MIEPFVKVNYALRTLDNKEFPNSLSYKDKKYHKTRLNGGLPIGQLTKLGEEQMYIILLSIIYQVNLKGNKNNHKV